MNNGMPGDFYGQYGNQVQRPQQQQQLDDYNLLQYAHHPPQQRLLQQPPAAHAHHPPQQFLLQQQQPAAHAHHPPPHQSISPNPHLNNNVSIRANNFDDTSIGDNTMLSTTNNTMSSPTNNTINTMSSTTDNSVLPNSIFGNSPWQLEWGAYWNLFSVNHKAPPFPCYLSHRDASVDGDPEQLCVIYDASANNKCFRSVVNQNMSTVLKIGTDKDSNLAVRNDNVAPCAGEIFINDDDQFVIKGMQNNPGFLFVWRDGAGVFDLCSDLSFVLQNGDELRHNRFCTVDVWKFYIKDPPAAAAPKEAGVPPSDAQMASSGDCFNLICDLKNAMESWQKDKIHATTFWHETMVDKQNVIQNAQKAMLKTIGEILGYHHVAFEILEKQRDMISQFNDKQDMILRQILGKQGDMITQFNDKQDMILRKQDKIITLLNHRSPNAAAAVASAGGRGGSSIRIREAADVSAGDRGGSSIMVRAAAAVASTGGRGEEEGFDGGGGGSLMEEYNFDASGGGIDMDGESGSLKVPPPADGGTVRKIQYTKRGGEPNRGDSASSKKRPRRLMPPPVALDDNWKGVSVNGLIAGSLKQTLVKQVVRSLGTKELSQESTSWMTTVINAAEKDSMTLSEFQTALSGNLPEFMAAFSPLGRLSQAQSKARKEILWDLKKENPSEGKHRTLQRSVYSFYRDVLRQNNELEAINFEEDKENIRMINQTLGRGGMTCEPVHTQGDIHTMPMKYYDVLLLNKALLVFIKSSAGRERELIKVDDEPDLEKVIEFITASNLLSVVPGIGPHPHTEHTRKWMAALVKTLQIAWKREKELQEEDAPMPSLVSPLQIPKIYTMDDFNKESIQAPFGTKFAKLNQLNSRHELAKLVVPSVASHFLDRSQWKVRQKFVEMLYDAAQGKKVDGYQIAIVLMNIAAFKFKHGHGRGGFILLASKIYWLYPTIPHLPDRINIDVTNAPVVVEVVLKKKNEEENEEVDGEENETELRGYHVKFCKGNVRMSRHTDEDIDDDYMGEAVEKVVDTSEDEDEDASNGNVHMNMTRPVIKKIFEKIFTPYGNDPYGKDEEIKRLPTNKDLFFTSEGGIMLAWGYRDSDGKNIVRVVPLYGSFQPSGYVRACTKASAHGAVGGLFNGLVSGKVMDHKVGITSCNRSSALEPVTVKENSSSLRKCGKREEMNLTEVVELNDDGTQGTYRTCESFESTDSKYMHIDTEVLKDKKKKKQDYLDSQPVIKFDMKVLEDKKKQDEVQVELSEDLENDLEKRRNLLKEEGGDLDPFEEGIDNFVGEDTAAAV